MDETGATGQEKEEVRRKAQFKAGKREEGVKGTSMISLDVEGEGRTREPYTHTAVVRDSCT